MLGECQHCLTKVAFNSEGRCPSCGKSKYVSAVYNREQIEKENKKEEQELMRSFQWDEGVKQILIGIVFFASGLLVSLPSILGLNSTFITYGIISYGVFQTFRGLYFIYKIKSEKKI